MQKRNLQITLTAMFLAMGLVMPMLFHGIGLSSVFLPMFWPVAAAAFFISTPHALALGLATPLISGLLTGMPPFAPPIAQVMMAELFALALTARLLHRYTRLGDFWILLLGFLASRSVLALVAGFIAPWFGWPAKLFSIAAVAKGLPGIGAMLLLLPPLIGRIRKESLFTPRRSYVPPASTLL